MLNCKTSPPLKKKTLKWKRNQFSMLHLKAGKKLILLNIVIIKYLNLNIGFSQYFGTFTIEVNNVISLVEIPALSGFIELKQIKNRNINRMVDIISSVR